MEKRLDKINKEKDKMIDEEISRQHESMSLTVAKQIELDKQRRFMLQ